MHVFINNKLKEYNIQEIAMQLYSYSAYIEIPHMYHKELTGEQKVKVSELLSSVIIDKQHSHERDLRNASVVLYELNRLGFTIIDLDIDEILSISDENYSGTIRQQLKYMANSYSRLVEGMKNTDESDILISKVDSIFKS
jgi:hypothetical protein